MSDFPVERFPDALRTGVRFTICLLPVLVMMLMREPYASYDPVQFQELIQFQRTLNAGLFVTLSCVAVAVFGRWQTETRNVLLDDGGLAWLSLHGWEGEVDRLPQRGLLPVSELMGMVIITIVAASRAPVATVFVPLCWSVSRSTPCWAWSARERPIHFGLVWLLHGTAVMLGESLWLALPFEFGAIVLSELLIAYSLRRKAEELLTSNVSIVTKRSIFMTPDHRQANRDRMTPPDKLFPLMQLVAEVDRPTWQWSIWFAGIVGWLTFCLLGRLVDFSPLTNAAGRVIPIHQLFGHAALQIVNFLGLLHILTHYQPFVWTPRVGLFARILSVRPIIWSWDRIGLPLVVNLGIYGAISLLGLLQTPAAFALLNFAQVLVLFQARVSIAEWQLTSDAKLVVGRI